MQKRADGMRAKNQKQMVFSLIKQIMHLSLALQTLRAVSYTHLDVYKRQVVADGRILENFSLKVNESSLTGESESVEKTAEDVYKRQLPISLPFEFLHVILHTEGILIGIFRVVVEDFTHPHTALDLHFLHLVVDQFL